MTPELQETAGWSVEATARAGGSLGLLTRTGSRAYGTNRPDSDHDFRGVYVASLENWCAMDPPAMTIDVSEPHDATLYELAHFARLAARCNPTALEALWGDEYTGNEDGEWLRQHRALFLSKRAVKSYGGYALGQLKRAQAGTGGSRGQGHSVRTKFKLHTMRLLVAGIHLLEHEEVMVQIPEHQLEPLRYWSEQPIEDLRPVAERLLKTMDTAAERSYLPDDPDERVINALLYEIRS